MPQLFYYYSAFNLALYDILYILVFTHVPGRQLLKPLEFPK